MATIFYGILGEGLGHATRSKVIIEHLRKKNKVFIFCGGRAYEYLKKHFDNIYRITSPHIFYTKNSASNLRTLFLNLVKVPDFIISYFRIKKESKEKKPDVMITDLEAITNYFGLSNDIPTISIDNQHVIMKSDVDVPKDKRLECQRAKFVIKSLIWKAKKYFLISFFFPELKDKDCYFVRPIIRKELQKLKPSKKDFVLVYQTSFTDTDLVPALIAAGERIVVYDYPKPSIIKNVEFREFSEAEFFRDLKDCRAIITNGGQSLICEAIYLKKPVLSVPIKNQFEQYVNGHYLQKLGFGEMHEKINSEIIKNFISRISVYEKNLKKQKMIGNKELFSKLDKTIRELIA